LYKYWASQSIRRSEEPLANLSAQYDRYCRERSTLEDAMKIEVLANSAVIGMTTTGVFPTTPHNLQPPTTSQPLSTSPTPYTLLFANVISTGVAKFHNLLQAVQPEIIIVEEAAEVCIFVKLCREC
jgi:hypothetical protein